MTSYNVCEDVKTLFMMIRGEIFEIILDTVIATWGEDIMIRTDLETTMAPL